MGSVFEWIFTATLNGNNTLIMKTFDIVNTCIGINHYTNTHTHTDSAIVVKSNNKNYESFNLVTDSETK